MPRRSIQLLFRDPKRTRFLNSAGGGSFSWDGFNANGQIVLPGVYTVEFTEIGVQPPIQYVVEVTVLPAPIEGKVTVFNSAGEVVQSFSPVAGEAEFLNLSAPAFVPKIGGGVSIAWGSGTESSVQWNGLSAAGTPVAAGVYRVEISTQQPGGSVKTLDGFVQVLGVSGQLLDGFLAAPNPLAGRGQALYLDAPGLGPQDSLRVSLYNLLGQLVLRYEGLGPSERMNVPGNLAGGIYLLVLDAHSASGGVAQRKVVKLAVIR